VGSVVSLRSQLTFSTRKFTSTIQKRRT
jgi:hypothetical protein